jgi:hypothetical protein
MPQVLIDAAHHCIQAKHALGALLILTERHAEMGTRMYIRKLISFFGFRLGFFLLRLEERPNAGPLGQFQYWYIPLNKDSGLMGAEVLIDDPLLAGECLKALLEAEDCLMSALVLLLNSPVARIPRTFNPISAIGGAKCALNQIKEPLMAQLPVPIGPCDEHVWSYVEMLTPESLRKKIEGSS